MNPFHFKKHSKKNDALLSSNFLREVSAHQEITTLHSIFKELLKTLRKNHLEKLPWYIILGPENGGKTTLLTHHTNYWLYTIPSASEIEFVKTHSTSQKMPHPICARINQDGVFIEIPGRYLHEKDTKNTVFSTFLSLIKKHKIHRLIQGIILTISFDDLLKLSIQKNQEQIYILKHRLQELSIVIKHPINLQIFFSKTDSLIGFNEFFAESIKEELVDIFGIEFSPLMPHIPRPMSHLFREHFEILLKKLNERVIWLLHRERFIKNKALISDFPHQFAAFKELLYQYIYDLIDIAPYKKHFFLRQISFFSNLNQGESTDYIAKLLNGYHLSEYTPTLKETSKPKSYFVGRLLQKTIILPEASKTIVQKKSVIPHYLGLATVLLFSCAFMIYLGFSFHQKKLAFESLKKEFTTINRNGFDEDSNQALLNEMQTLSYLQRVNQALKSIPFSFLIQFNQHPLHILQQQTNQNYRQILEHQFIPALKNTLTRDLLNASTTNPTYIYPRLKAYLALKNPKENAEYLKIWLKNYLVEQQTMNAVQNSSIEIDIKNWPKTTALDNTAIIHAQTTLNHLPKPLLAYLVLKGENIEKMNPFSPDFNKVFVYSGTSHLIPTIYTRNKLTNIYFKEIPVATRLAFSGSSILGNGFFKEINSAELSNVIEQVRVFYLHDYANYWQHIFNQTEIKLANNLTQASTILENLVKNPSPLSLLLKTVSEQTTLDIPTLSKSQTIAEQKIFRENMQNYFNIDNAINRTLISKPHLIENTIQPELLKLTKVLDSINKSSNYKKSSFQLVKNEYQNQAVFGKLAKSAFEMPQPLSRWLISLISNDWLILLQNSHIYLNETWKANVYTEYSTNFNGRYPLVKQSITDVELADFAHFFGRDGTLDTFFKQYLQSFIDSSQPRWQWRELYGQSLSNNPDLPLQLERARLIQKMFFSKTGDLSVEFYLMPMMMGPNVRGAQINIDGQIINSQTQGLNVSPLTWPGTKNREGSNLTFLKQTGEQALLTEKGPWSLFRLLDSAYIQSLNDSKHFFILFDFNGNAARYQLIAENALNPFIPNFISQFSCSEDI